MDESVPNTIGYPVSDAQRLMEEAGIQVELKAGGSSSKGKGQPRVIRQRRVGEKKVELTFAWEMYEDLTSISKGG